MADRSGVDIGQIAAQIFSELAIAFVLFLGVAAFLLVGSMSASSNGVRQHPYYGCKVRVVLIDGSFQYRPVLDRRGRPICKGRRA